MLHAKIEKVANIMPKRGIFGWKSKFLLKIEFWLRLKIEFLVKFWLKIENFDQKLVEKLKFGKCYVFVAM
jgi:hypothetical protein